jgi:hypothetical protein
VIGAAAAILLAPVCIAQVAEFKVRESAGIRRFNYPIRASFAGERPAASLRLVEEGKPIPAQFTNRDARVEVDFNASLAPFEMRRYRVEEGAGPAPAAGGVTVEETESSFIVRGGGGVQYEVPRNLLGLLAGARTARGPFVRAGSFGAGIVYRDDILYRAGGVNHWGDTTKARVVKRGPLVAGLRFESSEGLRSSRTVASVLDLDFPRSKSWIEARWTVDDPENFVSGLLADVNLDLDGSPVLVDFGATTMVYAVLRKEPKILFHAGAAGWYIDLAGERYAAGTGAPEGWAHVMDKERATAVAVDEFAAFNPPAHSSIEVGLDGRLVVRRDFTRGREKTLRFWLHFVSMPVQIGAATSPQSMQNPPRIEW